jgi:hypothetical protein
LFSSLISLPLTPSSALLLLMVPLPRVCDAAALATVDPVVKFVWKPALACRRTASVVVEKLIVAAKSIDRPLTARSETQDLLLSQQPPALALSTR